jgi:hypothetical protein
MAGLSPWMQARGSYCGLAKASRTCAGVTQWVDQRPKWKRLQVNVGGGTPPIPTTPLLHARRGATQKRTALGKCRRAGQSWRSCPAFRTRQATRAVDAHQSAVGGQAEQGSLSAQRPTRGWVRSDAFMTDRGGGARANVGRPLTPVGATDALAKRACRMHPRLPLPTSNLHCAC